MDHIEPLEAVQLEVGFSGKLRVLNRLASASPSFF
jgi:hypothetical protein